MPRALVTYGGWEGHQPRACADWMAIELAEIGFEVVLSETLGPMGDDITLIVPVWSIAAGNREELDTLVGRVRSGAALVGFHGAAATFHAHNEYHRLLGGTFVWHPDELEYTVTRSDGTRFSLHSEQYYMHVDPTNEVVATTTFADGTEMPVAWRRRFGRGRVFYSSLGHSPQVLDLDPIRELLLDGVLWATSRDDNTRQP